MVIGKKSNWLCRLGLHKWRNYGESVVVTWKEHIHDSHHRITRIGIRSRSRTKSKQVFTNRECLRCGIRMKRRLVRNSDGTLSSFGWEPISKYEEDEYQAR